MQVDLNELISAFRYLRNINDQNLEDIEWVLNGQVVKIDPRTVKEWKFTGLNNSYFPRFAFDKDTPEGKLCADYHNERVY